MAYFDTLPVQISQFKGSAQASDDYALDPDHGLYSQNIDFIVSPGGTVQVSPRRGVSLVSQIPNGDGAVTSLAPWYFNLAGVQDCYAVYYAPAVGAKAWSQASASFVSLVAVTNGKYLSFAPDGIRGYLAFCDITGRVGTNAAYVYGLAGPNSDQLFAQPLQTTVASMSVNTTAGAGVVTTGAHRLGFVFTTRNGYTGALNPVTSAGVFVPYTVTAPDGVHSWSVTVAFASIPSYLTPGGTIQIVMSSVANPARYFLVAGAVGNVPTTPGNVVITVNIADGDLVAGTDVTQSQNLLTANQAGTAPFKPSAIFLFSSRMGYVTVDSAGFPVVYFSDKDAYQSLTAAFHGVYIEGKQIPVAGVSIDAVCYIATLSGLYSCSDSGGYPSTWTAPARIDGSVGILAPSCILASNGRILLASEKGLFAYKSGPFPSVPLSYWQAPDWNRINWANPTQIQIVDDALDRVVRVTAPLKVLVTAASNTNPITITTGVLVSGQVVAQPHLMQNGLSVTITGVGGNTNANTTQVITVTGSNTFTIPVAGNGTYTGGGVVAPNAPNVEMSWNYSMGEQVGELMYSMNAFAIYRAGASGVIRNISTGFDEVWYAPNRSNPGPLIRRTIPSDTLIHRDVDMSGAASGIVTYNETSLMPLSTDIATTLHDYDGAHFRIHGVGTVQITAFGLDHVRSVVPAASPITLSASPGKEILVKWALRSEQQSIQVFSGSVDQFFILSLIRAYYKNSLPVR